MVINPYILPSEMLSRSLNLPLAGLTFAGLVQVLNHGLSLVRLRAYGKCSRED